MDGREREKGTTITSLAREGVIDLSDKPRVLRRFEQHRLRSAVIGDRLVRGRTKVAEAEDVEMAEADAATIPKENNTEDNASESEADDEPALSKPLAATITRIAVSPDGQWFASTDDQCRTHVFNLDSVTYHCVLPSFPQPAHALAFDRLSPSILVLALANNTIQVYDVEARTFPAWARPLASGAVLPQRFRELHDTVLGVAFDAGPHADPHSAIFWGSTWLCRVKLDEGTTYGGFDKKRKWKGAQAARPPPSVKVTGTSAVAPEEPTKVAQRNFKLVTHYRPLLFVDFMGPAELLVVERPLVDVLAKLPPAFFKPKYGAT